MPEVNQIFISHQELLEMLVKKAKIHDGKWMLLVNFTFSGANIGPTPESAMPAAMVGVQNVGLMRAEPGAPTGLVIDASLVNPAPAKSPARAREKKQG